ncbi:MAG TPA: M56 family metallopeptidase [Prolixibacteraceae bacterium]
MQEKLMPAFPVNENQLPEFPVVADPPQINGPVNVIAEKPERPFPVVQLIGYLYLSGMLISLLILIHGLITLLLLFRKAKVQQIEGFKLLIIEKDIPAFSFCNIIFISRVDYNVHGTTILAHEQQHIRLGHFYDLMLLEMAKMIHWFNPIIYWLIQDLKAIHEYQADQHTLTKGIDATKYQLLIIEKGVGHQKFALANSFNHCQIKNRITMMNKQKTSKAWTWKVATFLPLLALLLMAFGRTGENVPPESQSNKTFLEQGKTASKDTTTQQKEKVYNIVEVLPEFSGGEKALRKYLRDSIHYPKEATAKGIQGKVFVNFIVDKEGRILNAKVVKSVDPTLDAEALRVIRLMPNWIPGKEKGVPVSVSYTVPINFVLYPNPSDKAEKIIAPSPPPPNKDRHIIKINNNGSITYNSFPISINELGDKENSELKKNPKLQYDIWIEEGKIDERVNKIKDILKSNGNPKVNYSSFHEEKGTNSEGKLWSRIRLTPMDIK